MQDPWNPTPEEIRRWAANADSLHPEDWEFALIDGEFDDLLVELAGDPDCPHSGFFLHCLYLIAARSVGTAGHTRSFSDLERLLARAESSGDPDLRLWTHRSRLLMANPNKYRTRLCWRGTGI